MFSIVNTPLCGITRIDRAIEHLRNADAGSCRRKNAKEAVHMLLQDVRNVNERISSNLTLVALYANRCPLWTMIGNLGGAYAFMECQAIYKDVVKQFEGVNAGTATDATGAVLSTFNFVSVKGDTRDKHYVDKLMRGIIGKGAEGAISFVYDSRPSSASQLFAGLSKVQVMQHIQSIPYMNQTFYQDNQRLILIPVGGAVAMFVEVGESL